MNKYTGFIWEDIFIAVNVYSSKCVVPRVMISYADGATEARWLHCKAIKPACVSVYK